MPNSRPVLRFLLALAPVLAAALLAGCGGKDEAAAAGPRGGNPPVPVTTVVLRLQPFADRVQAIGTVQARESVTVTAKVSETVQQVHFDSGEEVARGAVLVTLSGQQQQAALAEAQAAAEEAERQYRRQSELAAQQLIARSQLDSARATRDAARARVALVRAQLGERVIRAPFAGRLGIRQVSPGALVTPGTPIATLDDLSRVYVDFPVPEALLTRLAPGLRISGTSVAHPGRVFEGTVSAVDARVDPDTRAVTVRGEFANPDRALRPGMLVTVQLMQAERRALLVPEIAIVQVGQKSFVYRMQADGTVEQAEVQVGARREGQAELVSGVKPGERIVVDGVGKLRPGAKVVEAGASPAAPGARGRARRDGDAGR
ncbi:efflux RND transporter periplasmic adaptor subunit [Vulcaniibacterium gelatinicum]|uniref:efflux RND transporter periplasmic adaptor subunit n=1 Tax=Vulcaniibacterium gelatinicum TaxID=2598725 RepID=UPI0011C8E97A|nr:efflux RND transporter periplasmic adaptor subunit [Vulcaniibacterium gelatinicum]